MIPTVLILKGAIVWAALGAALVPAAALAQDAAPASETAATIVSASLPRDLTPWGMFMGADMVVKAIMVGLAFASLVTWTIWLAKSIELGAARRRARSAMHVIANARTLDEAAAQLRGRSDPAVKLVNAAISEMGMSENSPSESLKERIAWLIERIEVAAGRRVGRGMGLLATIGATAPFVGLLGTVWGIMNSFIGISTAQTTNLAVVAPGIAEALLATALGLFAAIPAVVIYNVFARSVGAYRGLLADAGALTMRLVSRDCERIAREPAALPRAAE